jgi:hypothetical protein
MAGLSLVVSGLCSAGLYHGAVWSLTALGAVRGSYGGYRHETIAAALLAAAVAFGAIGVIGVGCAFASGVRGGDAWFGALHRTISDVGPYRAFALVVAVQFVAIISLETIEQVAQLGHSLGPSAALGAPLIAAIPIHLLCALAVVSVLFGVARAVVRAESRLRSFLLPVTHRRMRSQLSALLLRPYRAADEIARFAPLALRFANRPPPSIVSA